MKVFYMLIGIFFTITGCIVEQNNPDPEPACSATVKGEIYTKSGQGVIDDQYYIDLEIKNTGDRVLFLASVPYTVHFENGTSEDGTASWGTVDLVPRATVSHMALLAKPDVGLSYKFFTGEISSLELGEPSCICQP